jgi:hypothetical protein
MDDKRTLKKILTYNPKRKRNMGRPKIKWKDHRTEQTVYGPIHVDDDNDDDRNDKMKKRIA